MSLAERRQAGSGSPFFCGLDTLITRRCCHELGMASGISVMNCHLANVRFLFRARPPSLFLLRGVIVAFFLPLVLVVITCKPVPICRWNFLRCHFLFLRFRFRRCTSQKEPPLTTWRLQS
jgi:hypothetical protein